MPADSSASRSATAGLLRTLFASFQMFDKKARRQLIVLIVMMVVGAVLEAVGAAVIVPFIALINDPSYLTTQPILHELYTYSGLQTSGAFVTAVSLALLTFFICKNLYLGFMASVQFRFVYTQMPHFSSDLFKKCMARPLAGHVQTNSAEMIRNVSNEVFSFFTNFLIPAMTLMTEALVLVAMLAVLLWIAPVPTIIAVILLGGLTTLFYGLIRSRVRRYGQLQQMHNAERIKWVTQGLGSIKETKVLGREPYFIARFLSHELQFAQSARYAMLLNQTPRLFIETIAFAALFLGVAVALATGQDRVTLLPILALFAVASVRLLPSLNRCLQSVTRLGYYRPAADVLLAWRHVEDEVNQEASGCHASISKWKELTFKNVSFSYPGRKEVLSDLNLTIPRGTSIALVGPSGSGKTTLADLILGLLRASKGQILIDGKDIQLLGEQWRTRLGYIPQSIYLLDDTIRRNVAFGLPDNAIDDERVWDALRLARLEEHVRALPEQLSSIVGENGSKLSGGQRQRLGIARALYENPDILVLDEATSALDETTEKEIADTLENLKGDKTLVVIAHRPETINRCEYKFCVEQKQLVI
jgi:ABC-type multidrug transport system fused ATPase/permease subunit